MVVGRMLEGRFGESALGVATVLGWVKGVALLAWAGQEFFGQRCLEVDVVRLGLEVTSTRVAANRAASKVSATTTAIGCAANRIVSS